MARTITLNVDVLLDWINRLNKVTTDTPSSAHRVDRLLALMEGMLPKEPSEPSEPSVETADPLAISILLSLREAYPSLTLDFVTKELTAVRRGEKPTNIIGIFCKDALRKAESGESGRKGGSAGSAGSAPLSAAAERRLSRGIKAGDHVLYGTRTVKAYYLDTVGACAGGYSRTTTRSLGQVTRVTPTGLLRVMPLPLHVTTCDGPVSEVSLDAADSLAAEPITGEALVRRQALLPGHVPGAPVPHDHAPIGPMLHELADLPPVPPAVEGLSPLWHVLHPTIEPVEWEERSVPTPAEEETRSPNFSTDYRLAVAQALCDLGVTPDGSLAIVAKYQTEVDFRRGTEEVGATAGRILSWQQGSTAGVAWSADLAERETAANAAAVSSSSAGTKGGSSPRRKAQGKDRGKARGVRRSQQEFGRKGGSAGSGEELALPLVTCAIVGCRCGGSGDDRRMGANRNVHRPIRLHEGGFTFYAASYGPRYGDPTGTYVCLLPGLAEDMAEKAAEFEREDLPSYCTDPLCEKDCSLCDPDVCTWGESTHPAKDLFSSAELRDNRRALLAGSVVFLSR